MAILLPRYVLCFLQSFAHAPTLIQTPPICAIVWLLQSCSRRICFIQSNPHPTITHTPSPLRSFDPEDGLRRASPEGLSAFFSVWADYTHCLVFYHNSLYSLNLHAKRIAHELRMRTEPTASPSGYFCESRAKVAKFL